MIVFVLFLPNQTGPLDSQLLRLRRHSLPTRHRVHRHDYHHHVQIGDLPGQQALRRRQLGLFLPVRRHVSAGVVVSRAQLAPFLRDGVVLQFRRGRRHRVLRPRVADVVDQEKEIRRGLRDSVDGGEKTREGV